MLIYNGKGDVVKKILLSLSLLILSGLTIGLILYEQLEPLYLEQVNQSQEDEINQEEASALNPVNHGDPIVYSLENDELNLSFNQGIDWVPVPVETNLLFSGDYNGSKQELIDNSYVLEQNYLAFLYADHNVRLMQTRDKGETWEPIVIIEDFPGIRFRKVDMLNDSFGYVIVTGDRTMSSEGTLIYVTDDQGESWSKVNSAETTRLLYDGGFIDEQTGFLSYGTINPEQPDLFVTNDRGETWNQAVFQTPEAYQDIFVTAEMPFSDEEQLIIHVNQGPNGDYQGGLVKGKYTSDDHGQTWEFVGEVAGDEVQ
ncbi:WD40/YVTN/BNR-like repeat-containing protein [Amphibacillus cookii]|uniref:WD40/YVTN/BNR-like repeat-containing protein n=1 Tax=Amphibacillus cookii TaxID=767787 RepID=UPI001EF7AEF6|nr:oxidoreductase [Amphibacillus cookii]MBM7541963.1 hypothetical protein [Amphibacillus cookii]